MERRYRFGARPPSTLLASWIQLLSHRTADLGCYLLGNVTVAPRAECLEISGLLLAD